MIVAMQSVVTEYDYWLTTNLKRTAKLTIRLTKCIYRLTHLKASRLLQDLNGCGYIKPVLLQQNSRNKIEY